MLKFEDRQNLHPIKQILMKTFDEIISKIIPSGTRKIYCSGYCSHTPQRATHFPIKKTI